MLSFLLLDIGLAAIGVGLTTIGAGIGIGLIGANAMTAIARQPRNMPLSRRLCYFIYGNGF